MRRFALLLTLFILTSGGGAFAQYASPGGACAHGGDLANSNGFLTCSGSVWVENPIFASGISIGTGYGSNTAPLNGAIVQGNVGIGTTNPYFAALVSQSSTANTSTFGSVADSTTSVPVQIAIRGYTNSNQQLLIGYNTSSDYAAIQAVKQGTAYEPLILNPNGGNVGINTTGPGFPLQVNGGVTSSTCYYALVFGGVNGGYCQNQGNGGGNGGGVVSILAQNTVSAGEFDATSDFRKKTDIAFIAPQEGIDFIERVRPVHFRWKTENPEADQSHGYIAQQLITAGYRSMVHLTKDKKMKAQRVAFDGGYVDSPAGASFDANYLAAIPYLHAGLKELVQEVSELKADNDNLRREFDAYRAAHP